MPTDPTTQAAIAILVVLAVLIIIFALKGLILVRQAETEAQLASVLTHELGHISQRHFSRGVEFQRSQAPVNLAGMLAGLVLMATARMG